MTLRQIRRISTVISRNHGATLQVSSLVVMLNKLTARTLQAQDLPVLNHFDSFDHIAREAVAQLLSSSSSVECSRIFLGLCWRYCWDRMDRRCSLRKESLGISACSLCFAPLLALGFDRWLPLFQ